MDLLTLYESRFSGDREKRDKNAIWRVLCRAFFQKYIPPDAVVIDIAAGYCEFINNIKAGKKIAFDLNPATRAFANPDVTVHGISFFAMESTLGGTKANVVFASNVFEHLDNSSQVIEAMKVCHECLADGGRLLVLQPNIKYAGGAYWDFIDHKVALTDRSLIEASELCGYCLEKNIPKFLPYTTKSRVPKHPFLVSLYLKLMPLSGFLLGQQSFLVFSKRSRSHAAVVAAPAINTSGQEP